MKVNNVNVQLQVELYKKVILDLIDEETKASDLPTVQQVASKHFFFKDSLSRVWAVPKQSIKKDLAKELLESGQCKTEEEALPYLSREREVQDWLFELNRNFPGYVRALAVLVKDLDADTKEGILESEAFVNTFYD